MGNVIVDVELFVQESDIQEREVESGWLTEPEMLED